jgi:hypothetical protein
MRWKLLLPLKNQIVAKRICDNTQMRYFTMTLLAAFALAPTLRAQGS